MARKSAINGVAGAVFTALNVAAVRTLCPGGVYRNEPLAQTTPYMSIGPCRETPWNAAGTYYGSEVTVPVRVVTNNQEPNGDSRASVILDAVLPLLETRGTLSVSGWAIGDVWWIGNDLTQEQMDDGTMRYVGTATFLVQARQA